MLPQADNAAIMLCCLREAEAEPKSPEGETALQDAVFIPSRALPNTTATAFTRAAALLPLRCNGQYISPTYRPTTAQYYCPLCRGPLPASELSRNLGPQ